MDQAEASPNDTCRCHALLQQSWWQELLENQDYQVVKIDNVNPVADVVTISIGRRDMFLTIADIDWPTLLAHFEEPVVTRDGRDAAIAVHDSFADKLRATLALNSDGGHLLAEPKFRALG